MYCLRFVLSLQSKSINIMYKLHKILSAAILVMAVLATTSCDNKSKFHIEGTITQAKDSTLYLENIGLDGVETVDSVKLGEDGAFSFAKNAVDAPEFYRLRIAGQIVNISIDSTETVSVKAEYPSMAYKYDVEGSYNCTKIKELALHQMTLQRQINDIVKNPNLSVRMVADSINSVVDKYKNFVKREYIFKEPNKSYSYFALFQTVVVGNSYSLIFNPRNSEDDVKVFAAVATSWDTFHPGAVRGENLHNIAIEGMKNVRIIQARKNAAIDASKVDMSGVIDIDLADNKGVQRKLSDLKGRVVLLDFCAFADKNTNQRIMMMREIYNKYHAQGLEIYQVSVDGNEHFWKTQTAALPWISVRDVTGDAVERYNVMSVPTFFLIHKDGTPYKRDAQMSDINAEIKALL